MSGVKIYKILPNYLQPFKSYNHSKFYYAITTGLYNMYKLQKHVSH